MCTFLSLRNVLTVINLREKMNIWTLAQRTEQRECGQAQVPAYKPTAVSNFALTVSIPLADCDERPKLPREPAVGGWAICYVWKGGCFAACMSAGVIWFAPVSFITF